MELIDTLCAKLSKKGQVSEDSVKYNKQLLGVIKVLTSSLRISESDKKAFFELLGTTADNYASGKILQTEAGKHQFIYLVAGSYVFEHINTPLFIERFYKCKCLIDLINEE